MKISNCNYGLSVITFFYCLCLEMALSFDCVFFLGLFHSMFLYRLFYLLDIVGPHQGKCVFRGILEL